MKHNYKDKFNVELLKGKIVMAFTDPLDTLQTISQAMECILITHLTQWKNSLINGKKSVITQKECGTGA